MKKLLYPLIAIALIISSCEGPAGEVGPQGQQGPAGPAGQNAAAPRYQDFTLTWGPKDLYFKEFELSKPVAEDEFVLVFYKNIASVYLLPFNGSGFTADEKDGARVNFRSDFGFGSELLFIDNLANETYSKPLTFAFRVVVMKSTPVARLNMERYKDYNNLKEDYNLPEL